MKFFAFAAAALVVSATSAVADPIADRKADMKERGSLMHVLGPTAHGKTEFDAATVLDALEKLNALAQAALYAFAQHMQRGIKRQDAARHLLLHRQRHKLRPVCMRQKGGIDQHRIPCAQDLGGQHGQMVIGALGRIWRVDAAGHHACAGSSGGQAEQPLALHIGAQADYATLGG